MALAFVGAGALQIGLHLAGLPGWACPFKAALGIPCPGCGLTTATGQLLHGQLSDSLRTHAFASFFLLAFVVMAVVVVLPEKQRVSVIAFIEGFEKRTGIVPLFIVFLLAYWVVRLAGVV